MARAIKRTTTKGSKRPVKKWKPDPKIKGAILIPLEDAFDEVGIRVSSRVLSDTVVRRRADPDDELGIGLVTTMQDGIRVAWDVCGRCHSHVTNCVCKDGIYHPESVAWIRSKTEEWMGGSEHVAGRYYEPSPRPMQRSATAPLPFRPSRPVKASVDPETVLDAPLGRKAGSGRQRPAQAVVVDTSDIDNLDLAKLTEDAKASTKKYSAIFDELLNNDNNNKRTVRGKKKP